MAFRRTARASDEIAAEVSRLKEQLAQLTASIEASAKSGGGEAVRTVGDRAREFLKQATTFVDSFSRDVRDVAADSASMAAGRIRDTAYESTERLEEAIRQRPLTSVAIAVGIGCLLSMLVHRR
jgi:ElaB/YqjD/DUF883 family membrane-anchored ribosome-binding protein